MTQTHNWEGDDMFDFDEPKGILGWLDDKWWTLKRYWRAIRYFPCDVRVGVSNLIRWVPVIWQDRDWDHHYFYDMMYHKLKYMEEFLTSDKTVAMHRPKHLRQLKIAKNLAKRIVDDEYLERADLPVKRLYGVDHYSDMLQMNPVRTTKHGTAYSYDLKPEYEDMKPHPEDYWKRRTEHVDYMEKQDRQMLGDIIAKYSPWWWD